MQLTNELSHLPLWSRPRYADFGSWNHSFVCCYFMHGFWNPFLHSLMLHVRVLEPFLRSLMLHAQVLLGFGCCWYFHIQDEPFACFFVVFGCPCLQSMSSRGISCYSIPVGCPIAASPPGMQAKQAGLYCWWGIWLMRSPDGYWQVRWARHYCLSCY